MSQIETDVAEIKAVVRSLLNMLRPTIGFQDVKELLDCNSDTTVQRWLKRHSIRPVTKGRYPRLRVMQAIAAA